jgi:hypothetical protein
MAQAQQYQMNPMFASYMDPSMTMPGAGMMTDSRAGVFRQHMVTDHRAPRPLGAGGGMAPPDALLPLTSLQRTTPMLQFARPYDAAMYQGMEASRLLQQGYAGYSQAAGQNLVGMGGAIAGGIGGAAVGGFLGGAGGAVFGGTMGEVGGAMLQYVPGVNEAVAATFRPAIERRAQAIQSQYGSRRFMVGAGADTDISGSGLSTQASQRMMSTFDDMASSSGGDFTRQDYVNMMQAGGEQGLMDFAQNSDQIADTVKKMSKVLGTFAQITGDPDFQNNIKKMGQLRRLGLGMGQMEQAMQNLDQYARMAGLDVDQVMQRGVQGGAIYQGAGLSAAQGLQSGAMGAAQGRQLVASGAFTEEQLSLYGGEQGVGQKLAEVNAAYLSRVAQGQMGALVTTDANGNVVLDKSKVEALRRGEIGYEQGLSMSSQAVGGMSQAQQMDFFSGRRQRELKSELGAMLGAEGTQQAAMHQIMSMAGDGITTLGAAEMALGPDAAAIMQRMGNKGFQRNTLAQMQKELERREFDAAKAGQLPGGMDIGLMTRLGFNFGDPLDDMQQGVSGWMAEHEEGKRLAGVGITRYSKDGTGSGFGMGRMRGGRADQRTRGARANVMDEARDLYAPWLGERAGLINEFGDRSGLMDQFMGAYEDVAMFAGQQTGLTGDPYADRRSERAAGRQRGQQLLSATRSARRMGAGELEDNAVGARIELEKLGKSHTQAVKKLASEIRRNVGMGLMSPDALSSQQMAKAMGVQVGDLANFSPEELGALIQDAALDAGEAGSTYLSEVGSRTEVAYAEKIGADYMAAKGAGGLDAALKELGLGSYESMSRAEQQVVEKLGSGDSKDGLYLMLAALQAKGSHAFTGASAKHIASKLTEELREMDGTEYNKKLRAAKKAFASWPEKQQKALLASIVDMTGKGQKDQFGNTVGLKTSQGASQIMQKLKSVGERGGDLRTSNVLAKMSGKLADIGEVSEFGDVEGLAASIQGASQEELDTFRAAGYGDIVDIVSREGFSLDSEKDAGALLGAMEKVDASQLDISSTKGMQSQATEEQRKLIEDQKVFNSKLNSAMGDNTGATAMNTVAVKNLTDAITGNNANGLQESMKDKNL